MFTGIVQGTGTITAFDLDSPSSTDSKLRLTIQTPESLLQGLKIGASVSVDGVCLTAVAISETSVVFDLVQETLDRTTLRFLTNGKTVNIERSLRIGDEVGGHFVSGHVDTTAQIIEILASENNYNLRFEIPERYRRYIFEKGYIAINGVSLTISHVSDITMAKHQDSEPFSFSVSLIPETLRVTTFREKVVGDLVNIEIERQTQATVDTVERYLIERNKMLRES